MAAFVLCWTSRRWNHDRPHVVFSNDPDPVHDGEVEVKSTLRALDVEIVDLPFRTFDPGRRARTYRNAFYKLDAVQALSRRSSAAILLDADCLWTGPASGLDDELCRAGQLVLQETKRLSREPFRRQAFGLSAADLGEVYRRLDPDYPVEHPGLYGGEVIGGTPDALAQVTEMNRQVFRAVLDDPEAATFHNGTTMLDADELVASFTYNRCGLTIHDSMDRYTTRLATARQTRRTIPEAVFAVPIWHVPNEKQRGLPILFRSILDGGLDAVADDELARRVGGFVGVPRRTENRSTDLVDLVSCGYCHVKGAMRVVGDRIGGAMRSVAAPPARR